LDLFDVVRSCFRRWYIFFPLLLVVGWFSYSTYSSVKPVYYSNEVIGFSPPGFRIDDMPQGQPVPRNGLLDVGGASLIANMTTIGLRDPAVYDRVVSAGGGPYTTKMFPTPGGMQQLPMVMIEVTLDEPGQVSTTLALLAEEAKVTVREMQERAAVPENVMVTSFIVSPAGTPMPAMPSRTRSTIVIFAAGLGLSILLTVVVDLVLTRRKSRAQQRAAVPGRTGTAPDHEDVIEDNENIRAAEGTVEAR